MKAMRFFTLPTLLGWLAAGLVCIGLHLGSGLAQGLIRIEESFLRLLIEYGRALALGFILIVIPTYVLTILPLSVVDWRRARSGRALGGWTYVGVLLAVGVVMTAVFVMLRMVDIGWTRNESLKIAFFYAPFVPYAFVVALVAKRILPVRGSTA